MLSIAWVYICVSFQKNDCLTQLRLIQLRLIQLLRPLIEHALGFSDQGALYRIG